MFGAAEIDPEREPLKVEMPHVLLILFTNSQYPTYQNFDTDVVISSTDTQAIFPLIEEARFDTGKMLSVLCKSWSQYEQRQQLDEAEWLAGLGEHLEDIVNLRIDHVRRWIADNTARFNVTTTSSSDPLRRELDHLIADLRTATQLCAMRCAVCHLLCIQNRDHRGSHDCATTHKCIAHCKYADEHIVPEDCGLA
jgi:hypothetical protein